MASLRLPESMFLLLLVLASLTAAQRKCPVSHPGCECNFDSHDIITSILCSGLGPMDTMPVFNASDQIIPTVRIVDSVIHKLPSRTFQGLKIRNLLLHNNSLSEIEPFALQGLEHYLESLEMKYDRFVVLPNDFLFNFTSLKTLALDGNELDVIKSNWFMHMTGLTYFSAAGNKIRDIEAGSFDMLPNLKILYLTRNKLTFLHDKLFHSLNYLRDLSLGNNNLTSLPVNVFSNLKKLETLDVGRNQIGSIPDGLFKNTQLLEELYMPSNLIQELRPTQLPTGGKLRQLVFSNNNISILHDSVFNQVNNLERLALDNNNIKTLPDLAFESLRELKILLLQDNNIAELPANILVGLLQLRELNLQNNNIEVLTYGVFDAVGHLVHLDMSLNQLREVHFGPFDALRKLEFLNLSKNRLQKLLSNWFSRTELLKKLYLQRNTIRSMEDASFSKLINLEELYLDYNYIQEVTTNTFVANKELRVLSLSHNPLKKVPMGSLGELNKLQRLYLNYTCLPDIPDGFFGNLAQLTDLKLDHSPLEVIRSYSFSKLDLLDSLVLGHHNITKIETRPFIHIKGLTHLTADNMGLVPNDLANMLADLSNLTHLSLKHNKLNGIQRSSFTYNPRLQILSLVGNSFECTCQLAWLRENDQLIDVEKTICRDPQNQDSIQLAACFPLSDTCSSVSPSPLISQICQSYNPTPQEDTELDYNHCIVPPEPTIPAPTTVTTTPSTTIKPVKIMIIPNDTKITIIWEKIDNPDILGYRVRYRRFATTQYIREPDLDNNQTQYTIEFLESGVNYRVCVDLKFAGGYRSFESACKEIGINVPTTPMIPGVAVTVRPVVEEPEESSGIPLIPIIGAAAGAFIVIFIVIVIIVLYLRKTKTRFAENARKKEENDQMVKDKMGAWVNNFSFDGNVNETMGEQMMLDYDLFSGSNPTVSKARYAEMVKNGTLPNLSPTDIVIDADDGNIYQNGGVLPAKSQYPDVQEHTTIVNEEESPGDVSGSDPGYGESETGYNGSDSMQGDSVRNENLLF